MKILTDTIVHWSGRIDSDDFPDLRWHQRARIITQEQLSELDYSWVIAGFQCDEGVRRNQGRPGARKGPISIRTAAGSYPVFDDNFWITDLGDVVCEANELENAQTRLQQTVREIHESGNRSLLLGGGHEIAYPHFMGIKLAHPEKRIGVINFDAHFDLRPVQEKIGPTSGTGFWQMSREQYDFRYMVIGLQKRGNTRRLFDLASDLNVQVITQEDLEETDASDQHRALDIFVDSVDLVYVTICMDVFSAAYAPGVSAVSHNGVIPDRRFLGLLKKLKNCGKVVGLDIAEVNPEYDIDNRTSKLAASFLFEWLG